MTPTGRIIYITYMFKPRELGGQLKRARVRRNMTQVELAQQALLSPIFVAKVEAGERMPSWDTLARLGRTLKFAVRLTLVSTHRRR